MKTAVLAASILALAAPVAAQQAAVDHAHMHDAQATPPAAATPQAPQTRRQAPPPPAAAVADRRSTCRGTTPSRPARPITRRGR